MRVFDDAAAIGIVIGGDAPDFLGARDLESQSRTDNKRLDGRARLIRHHDRGVSAVFRLGIAQVLRVVSREIRQGQNVAGLGVQDDHFAAFGFESATGVGQLLLGDHLNVGVEGQNNVLAMTRSGIVLFVQPDRPAAGVFFDPAVTVLPRQLFLKLQFDAFKPLPVSAAAPQHMRRRGAHGIETNKHRLDADARDIQFFDLTTGLLRLVLDDFGIPGIKSLFQSVDQLVRIDFDNLRKLSEVFIPLIQIPSLFLILLVHENRVDIDRQGLHRAGHQNAVAIIDIAPARGNHARLELLPLGPLEALGPAIRLQVGHPHRHPGQQKRQKSQNQRGSLKRDRLGHIYLIFANYFVP